MFGFQGDYKRQRNINLGGSRRNESSRTNARTVLNKAHEERQQREAERRRIKAATQIQKLWRGLRDTANWRQRMREQLDISALQSPIGSLDPAYDALAIFVAYYNCQQQDISTLQAVLSALFETSSQSSTSSYESIAGMANSLEESDGRRASWTSVISMLLGLAMKTYTRKPASIDNKLLQKSLARATDGTSSAGLPHKPNSLQSDVLLRLIEAKGLYAYLSQCIRSVNKSESAARLDAEVALVIRPLENKKTQEFAVAQFSKWILSIPGLPSKLGTHGSVKITNLPVSWVQIADCVRIDMQQKRQSANANRGNGAFGLQAHSDFSLELAAVNTLGNMTAFVLPQLSQKGRITDVDSAFIQACDACVR
ncbi:hypothetical protein H4R99_007062, partial [Coemansia sp. RSA 1722]